MSALIRTLFGCVNPYKILDDPKDVDPVTESSTLQWVESTMSIEHILNRAPQKLYTLLIVNVAKLLNHKLDKRFRKSVYCLAVLGKLL